MKGIEKWIEEKQSEHKNRIETVTLVVMVVSVFCHNKQNTLQIVLRANKWGVAAQGLQYK